jgi:hypothetical protein
MPRKYRQLGSVSVSAEVDVNDVLAEIDDETLVEELKGRGKSGEALVGALQIERDLILDAYREAKAGKAAAAAALLDRLLYPTLPAGQGANRLMELRLPGLVQ